MILFLVLETDVVSKSSSFAAPLGCDVHLARAPRFRIPRPFQRSTFQNPKQLTTNNKLASSSKESGEATIFSLLRVVQFNTDLQNLPCQRADTRFLLLIAHCETDTMFNHPIFFIPPPSFILRRQLPQ